MKRRDVKIGMKVVPFRKSIKYTGERGVHRIKSKINNLDSSIVWKKAQKEGQPFLFVQAFAIENKIEYVELGNTDSEGSDFFLPSDFKLYTPEKKS